MSAEALLQVSDLQAGFDAGPVLFGINLEVGPTEMVAVIGSNGAGKSTLLGTISGLVPATAGRVRIGDQEITRLRPEKRLAAGLAHVPQGRRLFGALSVDRNLRLGAYLRRDQEVESDLEAVLEYFPALKHRLAREAGTLSGGEQQMAAIGRGLMSRPRVLMVDELSLGLAPNVVERLMEILQQINRSGTAMLLVEQDVLVALEVADRGYVLENGRVAITGTAAELRDNPEVKRAYLGI